MKAHLISLALAVLAVVIGLIVYNKFVVGSGILGMFESSFPSNYEVDETTGAIMKVA